MNTGQQLNEIVSHSHKNCCCNGSSAALTVCRKEEQFTLPNNSYCSSVRMFIKERN